MVTGRGRRLNPRAEEAAARAVVLDERLQVRPRPDADGDADVAGVAPAVVDMDLPAEAAQAQPIDDARQQTLGAGPGFAPEPALAREPTSSAQGEPHGRRREPGILEHPATDAAGSKPARQSAGRSPRIRP